MALPQLVFSREVAGVCEYGDTSQLCGKGFVRFFSKAVPGSIFQMVASRDYVSSKAAIYVAVQPAEKLAVAVSSPMFSE